MLWICSGGVVVACMMFECKMQDGIAGLFKEENLRSAVELSRRQVKRPIWLRAEK